TRTCRPLLISRAGVGGGHRGVPAFPTRRSCELRLPLCIRARSIAAWKSPVMLPTATIPLSWIRYKTAWLSEWPCYTSLPVSADRSEEHTSELQSREKLVCRLLLEKTNSSARTRS